MYIGSSVRLWSGVVMALAGALLLSSSKTASATNENSPVVQTASGPVRGILKSGPGVYEYLGIPFAAPPVGALRWRPPQAPAPWTQVRDVTSFGNHCPQPEVYDGFNTPSLTEDCLYLNVFTPVVAGHEARPLPVMFWIYGGGFTGGESNDYDGSKLAVQGNVIVVTINYRV